MANFAKRPPLRSNTRASPLKATHRSQPASAEAISSAVVPAARTRVTHGTSQRLRRLRPRWLRALERDAPLLAVCALLWVSAVGELWKVAANANGIDFYDYYTVSSSLGKAPVLEGRSIYTESMQRTLGAKKAEEARAGGIPRQIYASKIFHPLQPTSSPFTYSVWRSVSWLPYNTAFRLVQAASIALFVCALFALGRLFRRSWAVTALLGLAVCVNSAGLASELRVCNVNRLLVCGLTLYLWLQACAHASELVHRRRAAAAWQLAIGACMFVMVAFKPVVGPLFGVAFLWSLANGHWRNASLQVAGVASGAIACVAIAAPHFGGLSAWGQWLGSITTTLTDGRTEVAQGNYAPARVLELFLPGHPWRAYGIRLSVALVGLIGLRALARSAPARRVGVAAHLRCHALLLGLGFCVVLCTSRLAWLHWQVLLTPCIIALAPTRWQSGALPIATGALWFCGMACVSMTGLSLVFPIQVPMGSAAVVLAGDAVFASLCVVGLWRIAGGRQSLSAALATAPAT